MSRVGVELVSAVLLHMGNVPDGVRFIGTVTRPTVQRYLRARKPVYRVNREARDVYTDVNATWCCSERVPDNAGTWFTYRVWLVCRPRYSECTLALTGKSRAREASVSA